ncbi:hypothetical protein GCM10009679_56170 [Saccharothrix algeriensis]|uniref:Uncharacterized protein n=1 Tax=Catellatospora bangladeshensis TaxID=310355 RepID=A0A8J3JT32_9ACTN|nr:hypothetical protein Cba03nite_39930 [Catellatospora bangladeshensis]
MPRWLRWPRARPCRRADVAPVALPSRGKAAVRALGDTVAAAASGVAEWPEREDVFRLSAVLDATGGHALASRPSPGSLLPAPVTFRHTGSSGSAAMGAGDAGVNGR